MIRCDDLMNGYRIYQDTEMFCFGIDAVLLAHYPALFTGDRVLDLGTGFAPIPLILHAVAKKAGLTGQPEKPFHITGLEIQERAAEIAARSVSENGLASEITITVGDIRKAGELFAPASFSLITCNPPYMKKGAGLLSEAAAVAIARTEIACTLEDIVRESARLLKMRGRLAMIHRPERLQEICALLLRYGFQMKTLRFVQPARDKAPTMVLFTAVRGGGPGTKVSPPLIVYGEDHRYTEEIIRIYGGDTVSGGDTDRKP